MIRGAAALFTPYVSLPRKGALQRRGDSFRPCGAPPSYIGLPQRFCEAKDLREESEGAKGEGRRLTATREARERATDGRMIKKGLHFFYGCDIMLRGK